MITEFSIDESNFSDIVQIDSQYNGLEISNPFGIEVDAETLTEYLKKLDGIDQIEKLIIDYNSSLADLRVLQAFTNIRILYIYGQNIKTFDGIEYLNKGEYIEIQTHRNRKRDISQLSQSNVKRIDLYVERVEDYLAVAACKYLKSMDIFHSAIEPDFSLWKQSPVESIQFKSCKFKEIGNIASLSRLTYLSVRGCRSFERFKGDNSSIRRLDVDSCRKLDLRTLTTFTDVEILVVNSCTKELNLTEIKGLNKVKSLDLILCKVKVDLINLKDYFPNLEYLHVSHMKKDYGLQLKQLNPDVKITSWSFKL